MAGLNSSRNRSKVSPLILTLAVLLAGSIGFGGYYFRQYQNLKTESSKSADQKNKELIDEINQVYSLPKDETPVVAIVSDESTFKKEYPVFTTAKKDDALLLYEKAAQAILYRASEKKVIGTASFTVKKGAAIHIVGAADQQAAIEKSLTEKLGTDVRVSAKSEPKSQYTETVVIDLTGKQAELANKIAAALGTARVSNDIPALEKAADGAEIMIILTTTQPTATTTQ